MRTIIGPPFGCPEGLVLLNAATLSRIRLALPQSADNKTIGGVFDKLRERLNDVPFSTVSYSPLRLGLVPPKSATP